MVMNQQKIESLLRKIQTILTDPTELSKLEKDLVKDYLRTLYDMVDGTGPVEQVPSTHIKSSINPIAGNLPSLNHVEQHVPRPTVKVPQEEIPASGTKPDSIKPAQSIIPPSPSTTKLPAEEKPTAAKSTAVLVEKELSKQEPVDKVTPPSVTVSEQEKTWEDAQMASVKDQSVSEYTPTKTPLDLKSNGASESRHTKETAPRIDREVPDVFRMEERISSKYNPLFQQQQSNELSDRLSRSPIENLQRALSINDRLLTVNQLFNGNHEAFNETIDILNSKYSFAEAKSYLVRYVIDKYEWLDEEKVDQARDFIKLVERRFL